MKFLYDTFVGRILLNLLISKGSINTISAWLNSGLSRWLIRPFIKKNNIDMSSYPKRHYKSFGDFFSRKRDVVNFDTDKNAFISPCDSKLSLFDIDKDSIFCVKGSHYNIGDLIPEKDVADLFKDGLCMIFRLEATDYHHFCYIDDCVENGAKLIPGKLHSVQPIALRRYPVFRQNKRYYHLLDTKNFGKIMQIEVGAVYVGGVHYELNRGVAKKGQDAGYFELCGSTIMLLLTKELKDKLKINDDILNATKDEKEYTVKIGNTIGHIYN